MSYSIAGKQLKLDSEQDVAFIANDLESKDVITSLDFSGNTIGVDAAKGISSILLKYKDTLEDINLSDIFTGRLNTEVPKFLDHVLPVLVQFPKLTTVNLSDNALGLETNDQIEAYLSNAFALEHLYLSNNGMGPFAGERIGMALYKLSKLKQQKKYPSLKTFICGRNRLENGSMKYLTLGLINHKDLQEVRLYQNGIRPLGIYTLINGLAANTQLKVLDLQDNTLTYLGSSAIAKNLSNWAHLTELNLNDCLLKSKGFGEIVAKLSGNVKVLKIQYNELNKEVLTELYEKCSDKTVEFEQLEINGNQLDEEDELIEQFTELLGDSLGDVDEMEGENSDDEDDEDEEDGEEDVEIIDFTELAKELDGTDNKEDSEVDAIAGELEKTHLSK